MFLRFNTRRKDGKVHRYWSIVENRRLRAGQTLQRTVLYLGEINDTQQAAWRKSLEALDEATQLTEQVCLFPQDREIPPDVLNGLQVNLSELELRRPRAFGDCWLACRLWDELQLDEFWRARLPDGKAEVPWWKVLQLLTVRQLVAPGSKWHLHRRWFVSSAMDQLLDEDFAVAAKNRLYECLDRLDAHRGALLTHLQARWKDLFGATYNLLLYDLTSSYFEGEMEQAPKAKHGYSRDRRPDCRQVIIAVVLSLEGFPLAYEIMPGNTNDKTTLRLFLEKIQAQYGQANRIWVAGQGDGNVIVTALGDTTVNGAQTPVVLGGIVLVSVTGAAAWRWRHTHEGADRRRLRALALVLPFAGLASCATPLGFGWVRRCIHRV